MAVQQAHGARNASTVPPSVLIVSCFDLCFCCLEHFPNCQFRTWLMLEACKVATLSLLFLGSEPLVSCFHICGCSCAVKKWTIRVDGKTVDNHNCTQHRIQCICVGFPDAQKGHLLFIYSSHQCVVSGDVVFDEPFFSVIVGIWRPFCDSLHDTLTCSHICA